MKRKVLAILLVFTIFFLVIPASVHATEAESADTAASDVLTRLKQQLAVVFEHVDQETAEEVFSFLKEKIQEGSLSSEEGIGKAIEEAKEKFGVEISKEDAQNLVDAMDKLEGMGFSAEYVLDKAGNLYKQYGADFVDHVDEVVTGAVKNAASNAVTGFFENLKNSIKGFFNSLFS